MPHHHDHVDIDATQRLIDEAIRLGPAGLAARTARLDAADAAARAAGHDVTVTLEAIDPITGDVTTVTGSTMADAQAQLDRSSDAEEPA